MDLLGNMGALLVVILAFGFIIFVHELGHFLAARWAGVRVLAFALGFGPALVSYRTGLGWRRGSSEPEYARILANQKREGRAESSSRAAGLSPTEYRLNAIPFGGYVKMLGQVDADPTRVSDEPDGYQRCPIWKRMVIISAGVVMNILLAGALFILVFTVGLKTEPAVIGAVSPGSPAAWAVSRASVDGSGAGRTGLRPGDRIVSINGREPKHFNDVTMAVAMTPRDRPVRMMVDRPGQGELRFEITPEEGSQTRLMEIGVTPPMSARIVTPEDAAQQADLSRAMAHLGIPSVKPGMRLVRAGSITDVRGAWALDEAARASDGRPFEAEFADDAGAHVTVLLTPRARLQTSFVPLDEETPTLLAHLLGLTPVLTVAPTSDPRASRQGLQDGDIFVRVGAREYPTIAEGIAEIRSQRGHPIEVTVLRTQGDGSRALTRLDPPPVVKKEGKGQIGFGPDDSRDAGTWVALPPARLFANERIKGASGEVPSAAGVIDAPGTRILAVNGVEVVNFTTLREALKEATRAALAQGTGARVTLRLEPPTSIPLSPASASSNETRATHDVEWAISAADVRALHALGWASPVPEWLFEPEFFVDRASGPIDAIDRGLSETKRVMAMTYVTFARLFDGTVKVEHLKGPVGIAHLGTKVVDKGAIWLFFFMALISVNLAVINFLPLPITDGGQFIFLVIEQIRGRPAPIAVQNAATFVGLLIIGTMFLIVTYHDVLNLF